MHLFNPSVEASKTTLVDDSDHDHCVTLEQCALTEEKLTEFNHVHYVVPWSTVKHSPLHWIGSFHWPALPACPLSCTYTSILDDGPRCITVRTSGTSTPTPKAIVQKIKWQFQMDLKVYIMFVFFINPGMKHGKQAVTTRRLGFSIKHTHETAVLAYWWWNTCIWQYMNWSTYRRP